MLFFQILFAVVAPQVVIFTTLTWMESRLGEGVAVPLRVRLAGLKFWVPFLIVEAGVQTLFSLARRGLGFEPLAVFRSELGYAVLAVIAGVVWRDLLFYGFHRIQHKFLWRWHRVHHSIENLSAVNSYHHWSEPVWNAVLIGIPLSFVNVRFLPGSAALMGIVTAWPFYLHSACGVHTGQFRVILADNRYHRIHHSLEPEHFNKNFCAFFPFLDWLGGTMYLPKAGEWPDTGLAEAQQPQTIAEWSAMPWRVRLIDNQTAAAPSNRKQALLSGGPGRG